MRRLVPALLIVLLVALAGCAGVPPSDAAATESPATDSPGTESPTTTEESSTAAQTGTATESSKPQSNVSVEYVVRKGDVPEDLDALNVSVEVAFVEQVDEVDNCYYPGIFGENEPTPTALKPPEGDCIQRTHADDGDSLTVDLTTVDGNRSLGTVTGPAYPEGGHALLVVDATARHENGTAISEFYDETFVVDRRPVDASSSDAERVVVEIGAQSPDANAPWAYELTVDGGRASSI